MLDRVQKKVYDSTKRAASYLGIYNQKKTSPIRTLEELQENLERYARKIDRVNEDIDLRVYKKRLKKHKKAVDKIERKYRRKYGDLSKISDEERSSLMVAYTKLEDTEIKIGDYLKEKAKRLNKNGKKREARVYSAWAEDYYRLAIKSLDRELNQTGLETKVVSSIILFFLSITLLTIPRITGNVIQDKLNKIDIIGIMGIVASFIILSYYLLSRRSKS